ncbi:hypothetical protein V8E55_011523, partial [Tylopilus felleus]
SPQDVYARNLLSHHGYPLRTPEPSIKLPDCYRREGLKIGDVSVVVPEDGSFDVYFNLTLPREHPLHAAHGVPDNFTLQRRNYRVLPNAEVLVVPFLLLLWSARSTDQLHLHQNENEGAMLLLPQGADRHGLAKESLLLETVLENAVDWYHFARKKLYRNISNDALYLITGFHKARSWTLASFKNTG